jgi:hypothetical protein
MASASIVAPSLNYGSSSAIACSDREGLKEPLVLLPCLHARAGAFAKFWRLHRKRAEMDVWNSLI